MDIFKDPSGPITLRDATGHTTLYAPGEWLQGVWLVTALANLPEAVREAAETHWTAARVAAWRAASKPPVPTRDDLLAAINAERQRRIEAGKVIDGIAVSGDAETRLNLLALKDSARDLKAAGITAALLPFRDANNIEHMLTADQMIDLVDAGKLYVQQVYSASWSIKAMEPLPVDVTVDELWPASAAVA